MKHDRQHRDDQQRHDLVERLGHLGDVVAHAGQHVAGAGLSTRAVSRCSARSSTCSRSSASAGSPARARHATASEVSTRRRRGRADDQRALRSDRRRRTAAAHGVDHVAEHPRRDEPGEPGDQRTPAADRPAAAAGRAQQAPGERGPSRAATAIGRRSRLIAAPPRGSLAGDQVVVGARRHHAARLDHEHAVGEGQQGRARGDARACCGRLPAACRSRRSPWAMRCSVTVSTAVVGWCSTRTAAARRGRGRARPAAAAHPRTSLRRRRRLVEPVGVQADDVVGGRGVQHLVEPASPRAPSRSTLPRRVPSKRSTWWWSTSEPRRSDVDRAARRRRRAPSSDHAAVGQRSAARAAAPARRRWPGRRRRGRPARRARPGATARRAEPERTSSSTSTLARRRGGVARRPPPTSAGVARKSRTRRAEASDSAASAVSSPRRADRLGEELGEPDDRDELPDADLARRGPARRRAGPPRRGAAPLRTVVSAVRCPCERAASMLAVARLLADDPVAARRLGLAADALERAQAPDEVGRRAGGRAMLSCWPCSAGR